MTTDRSDHERLIRTWLHDGPTTMPDRVIDAVADRIAREPQHGRWRLRGRPFMTTPIKLAAGLAAVLVVALAAWQIVPGRSGVGVQPSPSPSASPSPIASPAALPAGQLAGGRYRLTPLVTDPSFTFVANIPAGWEGFPQYGAVVKSTTVGEDLGVVLAFITVEGLFSDPCHWDLNGSGAVDQPGDVTVGPTVDDLVTALQANTSYTSSAATPLTYGELAGKQVEMQVPLDVDMASCDQRPGENGGYYYVFSGKDAGWYAQGPGPGFRWRLFIVDVDGTRFVTAMGFYDVTPAEDVAAGQAIAESLEFTP
jgi:hypothetical protein